MTIAAANYADAAFHGLIAEPSEEPEVEESERLPDEDSSGGPR